MQKMSEKEALETLKTMYPKKCKMVDGRLKGGFDNHECKEGQTIDTAIAALEEIQQYRATGMTPEQIKEMQMDYCAKGAILEEYKAIGTVEEVKYLIGSYNDMIRDFGDNLVALKQYQAIGTLDECREAVEKQRAREPRLDGDGYAPDGTFVWDEWLCPNCGERYEVDFDEYDYCPNCGQHILWKKRSRSCTGKDEGRRT